MLSGKKGAVETRPAHVEDWLDSLPYANFEKTASLLEDALRKTNQEKLKAAARLQLVDIYWRPYHYLLNTHRKGTSARDQVRLEMIQQRAEALIGVALRLLTACKIGMAETLKKSSGVFSSKPPHQYSLLSTELLGHVILLSYDEYAPPPASVWRQLHECFEQAETLDILDREFPDLETDGKATSSIRKVYLKVLTTSLTDPHHLPSGAVWHIHKLLDDWISLVRIGQVTDPQNPAGLFLVDLSSGSAPVSYARLGRRAVKSAHRMLDCSRLQQRVTDILDALQAARRPSPELGLPAALVRPLISHLQRAWGLPPKRYFPRREKQGSAELTCGINSAYFYANNRCEFAADVGAQSARDEEIADDSYSSSFTDTASSRYAADAWDFVDEGPGGYAVYSSVISKSIIRVGDLVGLRARADPAQEQWILGVIRWLIVQQDKGQKIGIQVLAKNPQPAAVRRKQDSGAGSGSARAFVVPEAGDTSGISLITPKGVYAAEQELELKLDSRQLRLRAAELKESAYGFEYFTCRS